MKNALFLLLLSTLFAIVSMANSTAQSLEIRQYTGGFIHVQSQVGLNLLIRPNEIAKVPTALNAATTLVLGQEFSAMFLQWNGQQSPVPTQVGNSIPKEGFLIQSAMIGKKRAAIRMQTNNLNLLFVSVDIMSDQGFIATGKDRKVHLTVLTFDDARKLDNARTNLWLSVMESQQIALNPISEFPEASMDKFYKSLKRNRTLPTAVLPMIEVPNNLLEFGDRQVVLLKELR